MKYPLPFTLVTILLSVSSLLATSFYVDPVEGAQSNYGSISSPWHTLEEVVANGFIRSSAYQPLPYDAQSSKLTAFHVNAPIQPGDTLILLSGLHGSLFLKNYNNALPITLMAAPGESPVLEQVHLQACSNWILDGLIVSSEPYGHYLSDKLIYLESHGWQGPTKNITIRNCHIYSTKSPWTNAADWVNKASDGLFIKADSVLAQGNILENVHFGLTASGDFIQAIGNHIINFSGDGMRLLGSHILFDGNTIKNCYDVDENHDDGIQSFTTNGHVVDHNIIRNNVILNFEDPNQPLLGPLQGIGCFDGFYNDWLIENNLISVNHWHGITLLGANDCRIIHNTVIDPTPDEEPGPSWIRIDDHKDGRKSSNCVVANNIVNRIIADADTSGNFELRTYQAYQEQFVDYTNYDFHLLAHSTLIDRGSDFYGNDNDAEGTVRPQGAQVDPGCYEFSALTSLHSSIIASKSQLKLYPNPVANQLHLTTKLEWHHLVVCDVQGKPLIYLSQTNDPKTATIDVGQLSSGVYWIKVISRNGETTGFGKFIKL